MAPINIDVSQAMPQVEMPAPARSSSKSESQPSFDSHLQRASEQRPSSSPKSPAPADTNRNRQDSPSRQSGETNRPNDPNKPAPPAAADEKPTTDVAAKECEDSADDKPVQASGDKSEDADTKETPVDPAAIDATVAQQAIVAVVETAPPVPVAATGCETDAPPSDTPAPEAATGVDVPVPSKPAGHEAASKPATTAKHLETLPEPKVDPAAAPIATADQASVVADDAEQAKADNDSDDSVAPETQQVESDIVAETPDVPLISSMHRYQPGQPEDTHELAHTVTPDDKSKVTTTEKSEKVAESKPTGRRSERAKSSQPDADDKPTRAAADPQPANVDPANPAPQVAAAAAITDSLPEPSQVAPDSAQDTSVAAVGSEPSTPTATAQTTDPPATRPLPPEPTSATNRVTNGHRPVEHSRNSSELTESDRARFVQRVSRAFQTASERGGPLKLRLSPPELGSVRMEVSMKDGALSARLEAETPAARAALLDNLPALRERLAEQNVRIERFDVDLQDQSAGGPGNGATSDSQADRDSRSPAWRGPRRETESAAIAPAPVAVSSSGLDQLNVVI